MSRYLLGKVTEMRYRPDIDGLRALAVLSVIFYHVGFAWFKGGYVGVDVFFVISGYLISRNIASEAQRGKFSFANFYLRRARRLFPALFVTLAVSLAVGGLILVPYHLADFAESLVFSIFPASNIYFWKTSGYFSNEAILKPLLHIWSLSVEEQFYLVWPSLLLFLFTLRRSWMSLMILLVAGGGSLAYAELNLASDPDGVFYLTQYRIFEFIAGALCVWLVNHRPKNEHAQEISLAIGLAMIIYAVFFYTRNTVFPGLNAIPPVLGAMLVIYAGRPRYLGGLLANRVAVGIGLISYSLYLVHWPLLVFLTYVLEGKWYIPYAVVLGSLILATMMYFYVETPFRRPAPASISYKTKSFVLMSVGLSIFLISVSVSAWKSEGWDWRLPPGLRSLPGEVAAEMKDRNYVSWKLCKSKGFKDCSSFSAVPGVKNVVIVGDSHVPDALNALYSIDQKPNYVVNWLGGCPPLVSDDYGLLGPASPNRKACIEANDARFGGDLFKRADLIVINVLFGWYKPEHLERAINAIRRRTSAPIWVFGNYMVLKQNLPDLILKHASDYPNIQLGKELIDDNASFMYETELEELSAKLGFIFISKKRLLCSGVNGEFCPMRMPDGKLFTYDSHHLSLSAAELLGQRLKTNFPGLMEDLR